MPAMSHAIGAPALADLIRSEHASWDSPVVDREIFGTSDADAVAGRFARFCVTTLGSAPVGARFYRVSIGCVAGLELEDGRAVVVKAQRGSRSGAYLLACHEVRRHLVAAGFPCPRPIGEPTRDDGAWLSADELDERGSRADAHDPAIRRSMAAALARLVDLARPFASHPAFGGAWFSAIPEGKTFPKPHSPIFDFEATAEGAAWIDALASRARAHRHDASGDRVVGHFDWRVEHLRFEGERVVTSYDWDSLHAEREPVVVGAAAHAFTADWQRDDMVQVPSRDELRAFVADYEAARGRPFDRGELATVAASCVYSLAYTARCNHALRPGEEGGTGDFRALLRAHGAAMLAGGV